MISLFKYISARQRFISSNQTIQMMGGEDECDSMLLAQNEMLHKEVTYFYYKFLSEVIYTLLFIAVCGIIFTVFKIGELT